jgi:hypothetical protein
MEQVAAPEAPRSTADTIAAVLGCAGLALAAILDVVLLGSDGLAAVVGAAITTALVAARAARRLWVAALVLTVACGVAPWLVSG